ncbi:hypothetical protein C7H19_20720 [Aphanothece hegewaldii CCALA 016]|uniref:Uncharacterized protein n=1 Tax=Aphanothece hegewaldii CCALA 016 TaxID=2107694 RepID=A0A2T1LSK4_9CHRO|nr:hypothetical protein [Aphanothece hegewaldii]PSF33026.1 hypothetical protein C7H19_20720 [Aphanothece hegewaldii CCALA 016]
MVCVKNPALAFIPRTSFLVRGFLARHRLKFKHEIEGGLTINPEIPESALAYKPELVRDMYHKYGFTIEEPSHYGAWSGRENGISYQDIVSLVNNKFRVTTKD